MQGLAKQSDKFMEKVSFGQTKDSVLPSRFQHGDYCYLQMQNECYSHSTVVGIKFTKSKVLYDLDVQVVPMHSEDNNDGREVLWTTTRLHGVDSAIVISVNEYDEIKQLGRLRQYDGRDLVSFGQFLLSDKRRDYIRENTKPEHAHLLEEGLKQVGHGDFENWREIRKEEVIEEGPIHEIVKRG